MSTLDILPGANFPDMRKNLPKQKAEIIRSYQEARKSVTFALWILL